MMNFIKRVFLSALLLSFFWVSGATAAITHPNILINTEELAAIKVKVAAGVEPWKHAYDQMIPQANAAQNIPPTDYKSITYGGLNSADENCANVHTYYRTADGFESSVGSYDVFSYFDDVSLAATTALDNVAAMITLNGNNPLTITVGNAYIEPDITATNNVDGDINANITTNVFAIDTSTASSYSIIYRSSI